MSLDKLPVLIRREVQEHRGAFFITPLVITIFLIVVMLIAVVLLQISPSMVIHIETDSGFSRNDVPLYILLGDGLLHLASLPFDQRRNFIGGVTNSVSLPLYFALGIVVFFYLLGTLYDDRKDRSILFWKSMPVSDTTTVISKLLTAAFVAPAMYFVAVVIVQIMLLLAASAVALQHPINVGDTLWAPSGLLGRWGDLLSYFMFASVWCLPYFGWMLFVSAFARSLPFLWAFGVPFAIIVVERIFANSSAIVTWIGRHTTGIAYRPDEAVAVSGRFAQLGTLEFAVSLAIGLAFLGAAILMRGRDNEI